MLFAAFCLPSGLLWKARRHKPKAEPDNWSQFSLESRSTVVITEEKHHSWNWRGGIGVSRYVTVLSKAEKSHGRNKRTSLVSCKMLQIWAVSDVVGMIQNPRPRWIRDIWTAVWKGSKTGWCQSQRERQLQILCSEVLNASPDWQLVFKRRTGGRRSVQRCVGENSSFSCALLGSQTPLQQSRHEGMKAHQV